MKIERALSDAQETRRPAVLPWLVVLFLGSLALGLWFLIRPAFGAAPYYRVGWRQNTYEYYRQILALFVPYALALFAWSRGGRVSLWVVLGGALVLHLVVLFAPPPQSQDLYQYLFYGKMQAAHGANPYVVPPIALHADSWYPWIRWFDQTSVYGPVWMLLSLGVVKASGGDLPLAVVLFKLVVLALDVGIMAMIVSAARGRPEHTDSAGWGLLAYAWNPLILISVPLAGTADVALAAAILGGYLTRRRGQMAATTVLLTVATLIKPYAAVGLLLHLALLARDRKGRTVLTHAAGAVGIAAIAYTPYWAGWNTLNGLYRAVSLTNQSVTGTLQRLVVVPIVAVFRGHPATPTAQVVVRAVAGALLLWSIVWAVRRARQTGDMWQPLLFVTVAYLYLTPWFLYWYMVVPLVLVAALPRSHLTLPILTFSASTFFLVVFNPPAMNLLVLVLVRFGPPLLVFLLQPYAFRRGWGSEGPVSVRIPATVATTREASPAQ